MSPERLETTTHQKRATLTIDSAILVHRGVCTARSWCLPAPADTLKTLQVTVFKLL